MKIIEGYNFAVKEYGRELAETMIQAGIPKCFVDTACRFHKNDGVPIEQLQDDWKKWNRYVVKNSQFISTDKHNKNLSAFSTYLDFKRTLQSAMKPYICPNPIYDDGNISIGECKTQRDARLFPSQNLSNPDANNDFCICKKDGGYQQFQKYIKDGRRIFLIYDKSRSISDPYKRMLMMSKDGILYFWNNYDLPCGTTKDRNDPIWEYIDSLPQEAQLALSRITEEITESKINRNMKQNKKTITEVQLRNIVADAVKRVLKEDNMGIDCPDADNGYNSSVDPDIKKDLEAIYNAAANISYFYSQKHDNMSDDDYESYAMHYPKGGEEFKIRKWAEEVGDKTSSWLGRLGYFD